MIVGFSKHPFGIIRFSRSAIRPIAVAPIHRYGVAVRHVNHRDTT